MPSLAGQMQEGKVERKYSNRYVEFLYHWETSRRIKRQVKGPPENYQHPNSIHGQRVVRLGKGLPPRDSQEGEQLRIQRKRIIPNKSFQSQSDLLCPSRPATAPDGSVRLYLDENHQRALQACGGRGTASSMKGAGVTVVAEEEPHKPSRARGTANPGHGLSQEMVQTLAFNPQAPAPPQQLLSNSRKLVWSIAPELKTVASALRHRMSDPASEAKPAKLVVQRPQTPNLHACSTEERRTAFFGSLQAYAKNKVVGDFGTLRANSGLRTLAGYVR